MKKIMIFATVTLLMSSCGVYNKYERPEVDTKGLIRDAVSDVDTLVVQDTASFGNLPWRSVFTDPQLRKLIEQGLEKNANLQNAALTVQMYETMLKAAKLAFLPAIQFGQQANMASISTVYTDPSMTTKSYTLPVTASWTLDLFGVMSDKILILPPSFTEPFSEIRPMAIPATGALIGTPASIKLRQPPQTEAMEEEPFDSWISDTTRMVYGKSSGSGRTAARERSAK